MRSYGFEQDFGYDVGSDRHLKAPKVNAVKYFLGGSREPSVTE